MPVYDPPLTVLAPEDGRDAQGVALRLGAANGCGGVLDADQVGQVTPYAGRGHFVLERLAIREPRRENFERRANLAPPRLGEDGAEERDRIVLGPEGDARSRVAVMERRVRLGQTRQHGLEEIVGFAHGILHVDMLCSAAVTVPERQGQAYEPDQWNEARRSTVRLSPPRVLSE
jgi:hypothetical protein